MTLLPRLSSPPAKEPGWTLLAPCWGRGWGYQPHVSYFRRRQAVTEGTTGNPHVTKEQKRWLEGLDIPPSTPTLLLALRSCHSLCETSGLESSSKPEKVPEG